jgi:hypothetical protein
MFPKNNFYRFAAGFLTLIALSVAIIITANLFKIQSERVPDCAPLCVK